MPLRQRVDLRLLHTRNVAYSTADTLTQALAIPCEAACGITNIQRRISYAGSVKSEQVVRVIIHEKVGVFTWSRRLRGFEAGTVQLPSVLRKTLAILGDDGIWRRIETASLQHRSPDSNLR